MSKNNRKIKIEYEYPEECHLCPIGEYIQGFFQLSAKTDWYDEAICKFCKEKDK